MEYFEKIKLFLFPFLMGLVIYFMAKTVNKLDKLDDKLEKTIIIGKDLESFKVIHKLEIKYLEKRIDNVENNLDKTKQHEERK